LKESLLYRMTRLQSKSDIKNKRQESNKHVWMCSTGVFPVLKVYVAVSPKSRYTSTKIHGVTYRKSV